MLNPSHCRRYLKAFDLRSLFIEELGWDSYNAPLEVSVDDVRFTLQAVAEKRDVVALALDATSAPGSTIPLYATRRMIERRVAQSFRQHIVVYLDRTAGEQIWQWVRREPGRPLACREHRYAVHQSGDSLIQKLQAIAFSLEEEETLTHVHVTGRLRAAFNVERATKQFYDRFKKERDAFQAFLQGIPDEELARWYVSVMLDRLMFIYFIQRKGFLDGDPDYLQTKLAVSQTRAVDCFYPDLLCPLFFEGFARRKSDRSPEAQALLGDVPFLNGGIFQRHEVERLHGKRIQIPDAAFERLFAFFDGYQWHLDDRPLRDDREINPDVLGYIFEKYVNQKQMGAYYTQEDITSYISRNTILPFLLDEVCKACPSAFQGGDSMWELLSSHPDRYIYDAVRAGTDLPLPPEIEAGMDDVSKRDAWNTPAPKPYALPTEIWRETVARRQRYAAVRAKLAAGEVRLPNDLVTLNLDIEQFALDLVENCDSPDLLRAIWLTLNRMTVLDPTCGSGAFLFAALNVLEPLYEACLARMEAFLDELPPDAHPQKLKDFRAVLERVAQHPNQRYFVFKSIVINNLYGVDIMAEAVEIARLRLFLKLVAQVDRVENVEPLPDIDFNIQAGNALVGFATYEEVERAVQTSDNGQMRMMLFDDPMVLIEQKAQDVDRLYRRFRRQQTELGGEVTEADKHALRERLDALAHELDRYLAREYGVDADVPMDLDLWRSSHQPFHWFVEFYNTMRNGGFDVAIGNPPYVEYSKIKKEYTVRGYETEGSGNLYAYVLERCFGIVHSSGRIGMIVQLPIVCTDRMAPLQRYCLQNSTLLHFANFDDRPAKLFDGLEHIRASIALAKSGVDAVTKVYSTTYNRWYSQARSYLFDTLESADITGYLKRGCIPKTGSALAKRVIARIWGFSPLGLHLSQTGKYEVYFHNAPQYWIRAMDFVPYFWNERDGEKMSTQVKVLRVANEADSHAVTAMLNSSLFYWWYIICSDCRHLNLREIRRFPSGLGDMPEPLKHRLGDLTTELMADLRRNARRREAFYRTTGKVIYDEFYPRHSKQIIEEIDHTLVQHYKLSDEELDFIITYDAKYRMGDELFEDTDASEDE